MRRLAAVLAGIATAVLILAVVYVALILLAPRRNLPIDYYRVIDADTIAIGTTTSGTGAGQPDVWTRATIQSESAEEVVVVVEYSNWPFGFSQEVPVPIELTVDLSDPLGDRDVVAPDGRTIPQRG